MNRTRRRLCDHGIHAWVRQLSAAGGVPRVVRTCQVCRARAVCWSLPPGGRARGRSARRRAGRGEGARLSALQTWTATGLVVCLPFHEGRWTTTGHEGSRPGDATQGRPLDLAARRLMDLIDQAAER
jgi:hypothetical protein